LTIGLESSVGLYTIEQIGFNVEASAEDLGRTLGDHVQVTAQREGPKSPQDIRVAGNVTVAELLKYALIAIAAVSALALAMSLYFRKKQR